MYSNVYATLSVLPLLLAPGALSDLISTSTFIHHCSLASLYCAQCTVLWIIYTVHCALGTVYFALCTVNCIEQCKERVRQTDLSTDARAMSLPGRERWENIGGISSAVKFGIGKVEYNRYLQSSTIWNRLVQTEETFTVQCIWNMYVKILYYLSV